MRELTAHNKKVMKTRRAVGQALRLRTGAGQVRWTKDKTSRQEPSGEDY